MKSSDIEHNCNTVHFDGWNESGDHDRFIPVFLHAFVYVHSCDMSIRRVRRQVHFRNLGGSKRLSNERPHIRHHKTKFSLGICCLRVLYNVARGNRSIIRPASGRLQNGERWKEVLPDWLPFFVVGRSCADSAFGCRGVGLLSPLRPLTSRNHREERSTCASSDNKGSMKLRSKNNFNLFQVFETKPGLVGLYISAAYSATLSTISTGLNSIATIFFKSVFDSSEKAKAQTGFT